MTRHADQNGWEFNVLAGAATVHDGSFLLLKRSSREAFLPDVWGIPAGQVHQDEDPGAACLRELHEETGLRGRVVNLLGYSTFASKRNGVKLSNLQLNFLVHVSASNVKLDRTSHSDFKWIPLDDLHNERIDDFTNEVMSSARDYYTDPGARVLAHDRATS
jgi:8-oxo-dGTP diphosphatase